MSQRDRPLTAQRALENTLYEANYQTYLNKMQDLAHDCGATRPRAITDERVLTAVRERAQVSAASILATQDKRRTALREADTPDAATLYRQWFRSHAAAIADYETRTAASTAFDDFTTNNDLEGTEYIDPPQTDSNDMCADDIDAGSQPIGTFGAYPAHVNCVHDITRVYDPPQGDVWVGQAS